MRLAPYRRQWYPKPQERRNTYPRSSRKRHITFATISSFFSSAGKFAPGLTLVRAACLSVAVAPKQSAKSIVDDCQLATYQRGIFKSNNDSSPDILPPELLFHNGIWHVPPYDAFGELYSLWRCVQYVFIRRRRRMLEPKCARNLPDGPEIVRDAANQGKSGCTGAGLPFCDDFLDKSPIFVRFSVI